MKAGTIERCVRDLRQRLAAGSLQGLGTAKLRDDMIGVELEQMVRASLADYDGFYHLPLSRWVTREQKDRLREDLERLHRLAWAPDLHVEQATDERRQPA